MQYARRRTLPLKGTFFDKNLKAQIKDQTTSKVTNVNYIQVLGLI